VSNINTTHSPLHDLCDVGRENEIEWVSKTKGSRFCSASRWLLPTKIPGEPDHLRSRSLYRRMHNSTGYVLVFQSSQTVQHRRRHLRSKFDPETVFSFSWQRLVADPFFRRSSPAFQTTSARANGSFRFSPQPAPSLFLVRTKPCPIFVAATTLKSVHFRYLQ
jgi:hypothetical protein